MNIDIHFIPHKEHKFTTIGHWFFEHGVLHIQISQELYWKYQMAVLFHELIEAAMCRAADITTEECDQFDAVFEIEYAQGIWPKSVEAGFDKRCPYRKGHIWGSRFERAVIFLLRASWKDYNATCLELMEGP
jgi:hypothetical protein